jgi:phosphoribosyl 1,2-cyclic phosphodiesterase
VSIEIGEKILIIDAGTGIRQLGSALRDVSKEIYVLLTHVHSDHVEGFPFFGPLYEEERTLHLVDYRLGDAAWSLTDRLDGFHFPLRPDDVPATLHCVEEDEMAFLNDAGFPIRRCRVNHPGGAYGYRIEHDGQVLVHIPDNELSPPEGDQVPFREMVAFCEGADVLSHDAQYVTEDMPHKWGWGHSVLGDTCRLAQAAEVGHLVLFHHDPNRTDTALDRMQQQARLRLDDHGIACTAAYEGLSFWAEETRPVH